MSAAHRHDPALYASVDPAIVKLLAYRYGDGLVYLRGQEERDLYEKAKVLGLISREGYLTPAGRSLVASHDPG